MKIKLLCIGKTNEKYLTQGIDIYLKRLKHYCNFQIVFIADVKKFGDSSDLKKKEAESFLKNINPTDFVCLLDEKGKEMTSVGLSKLVEKHQLHGTKSLVLIIGGAYGFDQTMYDRSNFLLSLSKMTFSHQMIRLFLTEQIYRAFTIIRNEKYHNS